MYPPHDIYTVLLSTSLVTIIIREYTSFLILFKVSRVPAGLYMQ